MWYKTKSIIAPSEVDTTSSQKWVYVRKNIVKKTETDEFGNECTYYEYDEQKIARENYTIFSAENENSNRLADIEDVLAMIIGGGF